MVMSVPNYQSVSGTVPIQARPDAGDWLSMAGAHNGTGVRSGGAVTANSGLQISVAAGVAVIGGTEVTFSSATPTATTAPSGTDESRIDLVVVNSSGTVSILAGTAVAVAANDGPVWPAAYDPDTYAVLARLDITQNLTTISSDEIVDKRVMLAALPLASPAPYQWLRGAQFDSKYRRQSIPSGQWTPVHWPKVHVDLLNVPGEGTVVSVAKAVTLTGSGDTIEVASGNGAEFDTPTATVDTWAVVEGGSTLGNATYDETGGGVEDEWTLTAHGLAVDDVVHFTAVGGGASGYAVNTQYKVKAVPTANTFTIGLESGGAAIAGTGDSTGTWTLARSVIQVVKYTGISTGTGDGGNDQLTGVSLGNLSLTTANRIAQAACRVVANPAEVNGYYLLQQSLCVAFEYSGAGNAREIRYTARTNFLDIAALDIVVFRNDAAPMAGGSGKGQHLQLAGQPGVTDPLITGHIIEVYQDTGSNLDLVGNGLAAPIIMQAAFTSPSVE